jgi:hypothetical protein
METPSSTISSLECAQFVTQATSRRQVAGRNVEQIGQDAAQDGVRILEGLIVQPGYYLCSGHSLVVGVDLSPAGQQSLQGSRLPIAALCVGHLRVPWVGQSDPDHCTTNES